MLLRRVRVRGQGPGNDLTSPLPRPAPSCHHQILDGSIPSTAVYSDDFCYAFRDIAPVAPTHILLIPKERDGLTMLSDATKEHKGILGHLMTVVPLIAKQEGLTDFRTGNRLTDHKSTRLTD